MNPNPIQTLVNVFNLTPEQVARLKERMQEIVNSIETPTPPEESERVFIVNAPPGSEVMVVHPPLTEESEKELGKRISTLLDGLETMEDEPITPPMPEGLTKLDPMLERDRQPPPTPPINMDKNGRQEFDYEVAVFDTKDCWKLGHPPVEVYGALGSAQALRLCRMMLAAVHPRQCVYVRNRRTNCIMHCDDTYAVI